jgi:peptidoglycan/LPS O-acetylase OafA/YrhL
MQGKIWFAHMLRGLAASIVAVHHLGVGFWLANPTIAELAHTAPLSSVPNLPHFAVARRLEQIGLAGGPLGVALFFLVSGFVIPISLEKVRWKEFLIQRIFRLYPTYWAGLTLTCLAMFIYAAVHDVPFAVRFSAYWKNLTLCRDWLWAPSLDGITWTLEIEIKFYLMCALLSTVSTLRSARTLLISMVPLTLVMYLTGDIHDSLAAQAPRLHKLCYIIGCAAPFLPYMFIGTCFYNHFRGYWSTGKLCTLSAVLYGLSFLSLRNSPQAVQATLFLGSYSTALVGFTCAYILRDRLPHSRMLNWLADVSYPLYCIHGVFGYVLLSEFVSRGFRPAVALGFTLGILFPCVYLVHRLVEQPGIRLGKIVLGLGLFKSLPVRQSSPAMPSSGPTQFPARAA